MNIAYIFSLPLEGCFRETGVGGGSVKEHVRVVGMADLIMIMTMKLMMMVARVGVEGVK